MVLLDRLRRNEKSYTELVFYGSDFVRTDNFLDLVTAILTNTTVHTVRFHDCVNSKWSPKQVKLLFSAIARLPKLQVLSIARSIVMLESLVMAVDKSPHLSYVDIWESEMVASEDSILSFSESLRRSNVKSLDLRNVILNDNLNLDPLLAAGIESLDILRLDQIRWGEGGISDEIFHGLESTRLTELVVKNLPLNDSHLKWMAKGLQRSSLKDLLLLDIKITSEAARVLAEALSINENLQRLCLHRCCLSDASARHISKVLYTNTTLISLELAHNDIGDNGVMDLCEGLLSRSSSVRTFEIQGNPRIQEDGIQTLLGLAQASQSLESMKVFSLSAKVCTSEQVAIQRKINSCMNLNLRLGNPSRNPGKRPKVWYE